MLDSTLNDEGPPNFTMDNGVGLPFYTNDSTKNLFVGFTFTYPLAFTATNVILHTCSSEGMRISFSQGANINDRVASPILAYGTATSTPLPCPIGNDVTSDAYAVTYDFGGAVTFQANIQIYAEFIATTTDGNVGAPPPYGSPGLVGAGLNYPVSELQFCYNFFCGAPSWGYSASTPTTYATAFRFTAIPPPFQYPVGPDGWNKRVHGFGSLNFQSAIRLTDPYAPHLGQDWNINTGGNTDKGKPVVAAADGTVLAINYECTKTPPKGTPVGTTCETTGGWGVTVLVEHSAATGRYFLTGRGEKVKKVYANYAHLLPVGDVDYAPSMNIQVPIGGTIYKGKPVGQVGNPPPSKKTGFVYPYHLHFEMLLQADASTYRQQAGYGWDLTNYTDASEFIDNNLMPHSDTESTVSTGVAIYVHDYGEGSSLSSPLYPQFLLDDVVPFRGVIAKYQKGKQLIDASVNPCDPTYKINNWLRAGCNYGGLDLGYNGEIFLKSADAAGTAKWIPNLPSDGKYRVSIFVPRSTVYPMGLAAYQIYSSQSGVIDSFTIDQSNCLLSRNGIDVTGSCEPLFEPGPSGPSGPSQYGAWLNVGTYTFSAGRYGYVKLLSSLPHQGKVGESVAADVVRFIYVGP